MEGLAQPLATLTQLEISTNDASNVATSNATSKAESTLLQYDLWSPYLGLQLGVILLTLFFYEVVRYFRTQKQLRLQGLAFDRVPIKGIIVGLTVVILTQSVFAGYAGYALFVKHWSDGEHAARELMYGNMISDALIATLVHGIYCWYLFGLMPIQRQWIGWTMALWVMVLSAAQLACCVMAAIGYAQAEPSIMTNHDVHVVRTMFRVWLALCTGADALISVTYLLRARWIEMPLTGALEGKNYSERPRWIVSFIRTTSCVLLPGNVLAVVSTITALCLEATAQERDLYSWLLICLSKIHGLGIVMCLNLRGSGDIGRFSVQSLGTRQKQPLRPLFITRQAETPPSILVKKHVDTDSEGFSQPFSTSAMSSGVTAPSEGVSASRSAFEGDRHPEPLYRGEQRRRRRRTEPQKGIFPVYPSAYAFPLYVPSATPRTADERQDSEDIELHSPVPSSADSDVTLTGMNCDLRGNTPCGSSCDEDIFKESDKTVRFGTKYMRPAGSPPTPSPSPGQALLPVTTVLTGSQGSQGLYPSGRGWYAGNGMTSDLGPQYFWHQAAPVAVGVNQSTHPRYYAMPPPPNRHE